MYSHCSYVDLQKLQAGDLGFLRGFLCRRHLKKCGRCRELLEGIEKEEQDIRQFLLDISRIEKAGKELTTLLTQCPSPREAPSH